MHLYVEHVTIYIGNLHPFVTLKANDLEPKLKSSIP